MADVDLEALITQMGEAAIPLLKKKGSKVKRYAHAEFKKLADTGVMLAQGVADGTVDLEEAKLVLEVQKHAARSVLLTIEGLGILAVEAAINAAVGVMVGALKKAFKLAF
jgi:hypothetical protein